MQIGETHQGIFDLSFFKVIPNITIMAPKDFKELEDMMNFAIKLKSPVVIRYPRGGETQEKFNLHTYIVPKQMEQLTKGEDVTIIAIGNQVSKAMNIFRKLKKENINAEVLNARFIKPFDKTSVIASINKTKLVVTLEDNTLVGGLATEVKEVIAEKHLKDINIRTFGYPDVFIEHGTIPELEKEYKTDENTILNFIRNTLKLRRTKNKTNKTNSRNMRRLENVSSVFYLKANILI